MHFNRYSCYTYEFIPLLKQQDVSLVQWLKLPAFKAVDRGFEPRSGIQVSKKQRVLARSLAKI